MTFGAIRKGDCQVRQFSQYFVLHEDWTPSLQANDIALVRLDSALAFDDNVQPVARAAAAPDPGQTATVVGWGSPDPDGGVISDVLRLIRPQVFSHFFYSFFFLKGGERSAHHIRGRVPLLLRRHR